MGTSTDDLARGADRVRLELLPLGKVLEVERGLPLQDLLFGHGVEFPCGGRGLCKGCRVRILSGGLPITDEDRQRLSAAELADGWRLACRASADNDLKLDLAQWEASILSDESAFAFTPSEGLGIAVDLGTTTIVAQLVDLSNGRVLAVKSALNAQARHGADVMSRIEFAVSEDGQKTLEQLARAQIGALVLDLLSATGEMSPSPRRIVMVGNTVMHHLFCGLSVEPLSRFPFESPALGLQRFEAGALGWNFASNVEVLFLPCLGGFVGSDILAGILATDLHRSEELVALIDLGTNGELVVGNKHGLLCASTAAGPAFEGARISMGMRAATGAISEVRNDSGVLRCHVIGGGEARGICGSGLVDAIAVGLDLGLVTPSGRIANRMCIQLNAAVNLNQWDVRELQLAKGAIAAGLRILLQQAGATHDRLERVYLAGAFGNYINRASAHRIGLLQIPPEKVVPSGNTALLGAKIALFGLDEHGGAFPGLVGMTRHVSLHEDPSFQEIYVDEMTFRESKEVQQA
jgi:uncharacterized 2Fe-2S/4Fe-4S cluster protein (DUF4445 family)